MALLIWQWVLFTWYSTLAIVLFTWYCSSTAGSLPCVVTMPYDNEAAALRA
jgi:hypothetical protein